VEFPFLRYSGRSIGVVQMDAVGKRRAIMPARLLFTVIIVTILVIAQGTYHAEAGDNSDVDAKAKEILRQMSDYMNTLEQFGFHSENSVDTLLMSGQKIQLGRLVNISIRRPNRLRADIKGNPFHQQLFYDGKQITLYSKEVNYYATTMAPDNIESALNHAEESFGLVAPAADLIYQNAYNILMEDVQSGGYVGLSTILGVECHHLAFRAEETDWQIWIENSKTPLPRKFVITSKWVAGAPQFATLFMNWDVSAKFEDSRFTFTPPKGAEKIDFLPIDN
jgi:hypothetical protein